MPVMNETDRDQLIQSAKFLFDKGFSLESSDEYSIRLRGEGIQFVLFYERYDEYSDIYIDFLPENDLYSVGWIACIAEGTTNIDYSKKLENLLAILDFIKNNYDEVIDIDYCKNMRQKIDRFIEDSKKKQKDSK